MKKQKKAVLKPLTTSLEALEDSYFGKRGTPKRDEYDTELKLEIIGEFLKQIREEKHITQSQLAKKIHMDKTYISKIENNLKTQRLDTLVKFLKALNATLTINIPSGNRMKHVELV